VRKASMHGYLHANSFIANCALVSIGKGVLAGSTMVNASALIFFAVAFLSRLSRPGPLSRQ